MGQTAKLRIVSGSTILMSTKTLSDAGIGNGFALSVVGIVDGFEIYLKAIYGPGSPRFGIPSYGHYEMRCSCGHREFFVEEGGYAVYPPRRLIASCPKCGAEPSEALKRTGYPSTNVEREYRFDPNDPEEVNDAEEMLQASLIEAHGVTSIKVVHPKERATVGLRGLVEHPYVCVAFDGDSQAVVTCPREYGDIKPEMRPERNYSKRAKAKMRTKLFKRG